MIAFYIFLSLLILVGASYKKSGFYADYIGKEQCNAFKGIFILLIFYSHITRYMLNNGFVSGTLLDNWFITLSTHIGQWVVAVFLFYSGFGVMESLKKKDGDYLHSFPRKRLLTTLLNFDVAVCAFILLSFVIGNQLSVGRVFLSLIGWESVGNSNWYIFVILVCYIAFYFSYRLKINRWGLLCLLLVIMLILSQVKEYRWYNTILCFPAGVFYSWNIKWIEERIYKRYHVILVASIILFLILYFHRAFGIPRLYGLTYNLACIFFVITIVLMSMKVRLRNPLLLWFGVSLFPLYIYQRLPMIGLRHVGGAELICAYPFLYVLACLLITMLICYLYKYWKISL
ncbi:MAG: acyltransferase family protein [Bacteroidaceae bacterium]|nr:acyltransferase family protein [Bacteroidaceae bacterium]